MNQNFADAFLSKMEIEEIKQIETVEELPDSWWYQVYLAVVITTVFVISTLGAFSFYFSS